MTNKKPIDFGLNASSYELWKGNSDCQRSLSVEMLERAAERIKNDFGQPYMEFHSPRCPVWKGKLCRCGGRPWDMAFWRLEDEGDLSAE